MNLTNAALGGLILVGPPLLMIVLTGLLWGVLTPNKFWVEAALAGISALVAIGCLTWLLTITPYLDQHFPLTNYRATTIEGER